MVKHTFKTITEQAKDIEENRLSPLTLLEEYFYNISKQHKPENIFTEVFKENALKAASDSQKRQRSGLRKSPLDGIPINWKDLFDIEGKACEGGSLLLVGRISKKDADIVVNASNCGLINLGKTHLSELAFSGLGVNPKTATPPNSSKKEIAPGGSSSGAAVATALYLSSAGIGSDTGGSVRIPAAWNNLVGFKPTHGNLSLNGALQLCPSFDTAGPITRTVQDSCYLYDALRGEKLKVIEESNLNKKKFLVDRSFLTKDLSPEVSRSFEIALEKIRMAGALINEIEIDEINKAISLASTLFPYEAYNSWKETIENEPDKMYPPILARFRGGLSINDRQYKSSLRKLTVLRGFFVKKISGYDSLLAPTCPILPPKVTDLMNSEDYFTNCNLLSLRNTRVANLLGLTSITIPTETNNSGLMLLANPHCEQTILQTAKLLEGLN